MSSDDSAFRALQTALEVAGVSLHRASATELGRALAEIDVALIFTLELPSSQVADALALADLPWVVVGQATPADIVHAMKAGAVDFVALPLDSSALAQTLAPLLAKAAQDEAPEPVPTTRFVGASDSIRQVEEVVERAAKTDATVLLRGESGTGKELVARELHEQSKRASGPFIKLNCAAFPDTLLESELFGFEKGAFTGASTQKLGRIELADGGTLFLDEIGDISPSTQVKLLRVIQEREIERLGGTQPVRIDGKATAIAGTAVGGKFSVAAELKTGGAMTLAVGVRQVAEGNAGGLIPNQPQDALSIGEDAKTAVGDYDPPNPLKGVVKNVSITSPKAP